MAKPEKKNSCFDDITVSHVYETLKSKKFMQDLWFDLIQGIKEKPSYKKIKEMVNKLIDKTAGDFCDVPVADDERLRRKTIIAEISIMAYTVDTVISQILFRKLQNEFHSIVENVVKEELAKSQSERTSKFQAADKISEENGLKNQISPHNYKKDGRFFNEKWLENPNYKEWLQCHDTDKRQAKCTVCCKSFSIGNMGEAAVKSHMKAEKHKKALNTCLPNTSSHISMLNLASSSVPSKSGEKDLNNTAESNESDVESVLSIGNFSMDSVSSVHTSELSSFDDAISISSEDEELGKVKKRLSLKEVSEIYLNKPKPMNGKKQIKRKRKKQDDYDSDEDYKVSSSLTGDDLALTNDPSARKNLPQRVRKPNSKYSSDTVICPMKMFSNTHDTTAVVQSKSPPQVKETQPVIPAIGKEISSTVSPKKRGRPRKVIANDLQQKTPLASENANGMLQTKQVTSQSASSTSNMYLHILPH
ncbi:uncharacterized protein LOC118191263 isoform X2 [Stegodyphus dumicola]|uniref:uncharacterized protein LOC118191263 isoform X2 n=1 Tax=Stegodyphus dumicola TaxID=202533 RepID=UPI0015B3041E|nr:uncharacterized protein LOC118191263 isoform X2 [Stegodyphus dumicola]